MRPFKMAERLKSVRHAGDGILALLRREPNARIHLAATVAAGAAGIALGLSPGEWAAIVLAIVIVWIAEALNTAIEILADVAHPEYHPEVGVAKDIAAAGVLMSAAGAALVGAFVFLPHIV